MLKLDIILVFNNIVHDKIEINRFITIQLSLLLSNVIIIKFVKYI